MARDPRIQYSGSPEDEQFRGDFLPSPEIPTYNPTPATTRGFTGEYAPSLDDLLNENMSTILSRMGVDPGEYEMYAPSYDGTAERQIRQEGILERKAITSQQRAASSMYEMGVEALQKQSEEAALSSQANMYQSFQQGQTIASAGLGKRSNISDRTKSAVIGQYEGQIDTLEAKQNEAFSKFEQTVSDLDLKSELSQLEQEQKISKEQKKYEEDFWEFMMFWIKLIK